ncbi:MAG: hypothetical protein JO362_10740 [Streptomycetaceae bacterium]|nr:hypothetical protein [Streptomycetaceae bacterium]
MNRKLQAARRQLERLEWEHARALPDSATKLHLEAQIRDARWAVEDEQRAVDTRSVRAARRTAVVLDLVLIVVAVLVMVFSLGNVHRFAVGHGVLDPLGWLLAPAVDLALVGSLSADAFLSRHGSDAGGWAAALRWFAGLATLTLNAWNALTRGAVGDIVATVIPPLLLLLLAEAAPRLRQRAHLVVEAVRTQTQRTPDAPRTGATPATPDARPTGADERADDTAVPAGQPATAPASDTAPKTTSEDVSASAFEGAHEHPSAPRPKPRTAASGRASGRTRQTSGAGRNARPVRTDEELIAELLELRTGASEPFSQRAAQAALGIGAPRLRALLATYGLTLDPIPLPAPRPLRAVETETAPAAVGVQ